MVDVKEAEIMVIKVPVEEKNLNLRNLTITIYDLMLNCNILILLEWSNKILLLSLFD